MMGNYAPLFLQITNYKFTQTKQNTVSKRGNANLICTLPIRTNVSIFMTFRASRSYRDPRARNCIASVILVLSEVVMYGKEIAGKFLMWQNF